MKTELQCPVPQFDWDIITLGHGSGGLLTHQLLKQGVFDFFGNDQLNQQHDGAILPLRGPVAFSTDSYVISPIFFPGGNIGELAVNGTVNDLAMCGAIPEYLSLSFILEEGLRMDDFREILKGIYQAAQRAGVRIVTGDTKVVEKGKGDQIFINTTGIGHLHPKAQIHHNRIAPGDRILVSGPLASHGMAIMSKREGLEFETDIVSDTTNLNHSIIDLLDRFGTDIKFLRDPTRGGLASVLNELAEITGLSLLLRQDEIPVSEQVEGACEMLGLDPLYVANEGLFVAIVSESAAPEILEVLKQDQNGTEAALIGQVVESPAGKVLLRNRIGGHRVIHFLPGEQLPRIC